MVRFGTIGTNWITESFIQATKELSDFQLTAVYSRKEDTGRKFASQFGDVEIFTSLEKMVQGDYIDAIYIASPNAFHAEHAIYCMNHGIHVICEKPMASNEREVVAMVEAAKKNNVVLMEALKTTLLPNFRAIQKNIYKIGKVRKYVANYCQYSSRYDAYKEGNILNAFKPELSNGSLMDIGVYTIYPMVVLFGEPNNILASGTKLETGVDGQGSILFSYGDKEGIVSFSKISNSYLSTEIQGEEGSILLDQFNVPKKVEIRYKDGTVEDISTPQKNNAMYYEAEEFLSLIKNGQKESAINSHENSLITARLTEAARKQIGVVYPADHEE